MAQVETWYWIDQDAKRLMRHTEYDGAACVRHGCCQEDEPVEISGLTVDQARRALRDLAANVPGKRG